VSSIVITPVSESEDLLVLGPSNPTEFAYEDRIFYTPMLTSSRSSWQLQTAIRLSTVALPDHTSSFNVLCSISTTDLDAIQLPARFRDEVLLRFGLIEEVSNYHFDGVAVVFELEYVDSLSLLPSIEIEIPTVHGTHAQIAKLDPQDYVVESDDSNEYRIFFEQRSSQFKLTNRILKNLLIHIDYENQRVGFADPLIEL